MIKDDFWADFEIRKLEENETISSFDCGDRDLNDFILNEAHLYQSELLSVNYVLQHKETKDFVGFVSLANDRVSINDFPENRLFNRFRKRFPNRKRITSYPAVKICRLAVHESYKGRSLGSFLLRFVKTYLRFDNKTGCRFLTVDAYESALPFYHKHQFLPLVENDSDKRTRLLYYDLASMI
jgi:GNAT superfamily N-acetyltransferase